MDKCVRGEGKTIIFLVAIFVLFSSALSSNITESNSTTASVVVNPYSPLIQCNLLPSEFVVCDQPQFAVNETEVDDQFLCTPVKSKKYKHSEVESTSVYCHVVDKTIECAGNRTFVKQGIPCLKYAGYSFISVLLQSVFIGCLGADRFTLGYTGRGIGKLISLGGVGVWWFIDIILLLTGELVPADNSDWNIYY